MIGWRFWNWTTAAWNWAANWRYAAPTSSSWRRASSGWRSWTCRWMKRRPKSVEARLEADARPNRWGIKPRWLSSSRWCSRAPNWGRSSSTTGSSAGVNRIKFSRYPSIHRSIHPSTRSWKRNGWMGFGSSLLNSFCHRFEIWNGCVQLWIQPAGIHPCIRQTLSISLNRDVNWCQLDVSSREFRKRWNGCRWATSVWTEWWCGRMHPAAAAVEAPLKPPPSRWCSSRRWITWRACRSTAGRWPPTTPSTSAKPSATSRRRRCWNCRWSRLPHRQRESSSARRRTEAVWLPLTPDSASTASRRPGVEVAASWVVWCV